MDKLIDEKYNLWLEKATEDKDLIEELKRMNDKEKEDSFYRDLEFGTGGLRGVIGAGTNRMNVYTVAKASQGLANYIIKNFKEEDRKIAVSFDSRIKSDLFSKVASGVFAANGIRVYIYKELMPTPCLSFAVRELHCAAGIMVTASHNPSKYNGYKVYGNDGCQITTKAAEEILNEINNVDIFNDVKKSSFENNSLIEYIDDSVYTKFIECVKNESVLYGDEINKDVSIVYSPLNGTGLKPVLRILKETGFTNVKVVSEQEQPDGNFPTCPYPNPEIKEAMSLGMEYARKYNADLLIATDPDCDRVGIAVKDKEDYKLITGNEVGLLLFDFICSQRIKHNKMPKDPLLVKTIVTTDLAEKIADNYGVKVKNVLTGFKFIGEQIGFLEKENKENNYIFGFEESYGYLSGNYVRDKDAVDGAFMICEMFAYYKTRNISLIEKLNELYEKYGYMINSLKSFEFEGASGFEKMQKLMKDLRDNPLNEIGNKKVLKALDYSVGIEDLPKSNVLKYYLEDGCSVVIRPSGTEPKIKAYISISSNSRNKALLISNIVIDEINRMLVK